MAAVNRQILGMMPPPPHDRHRGFTLIELLVVVGIIALLIAILLPSLGRARGMAKRVRCAANIRAMGLAMSIYSAAEPDHSFPRAPYQPPQHLQLDNAGYLVPDTFGNSGYVGVNNVPASMYLLMKTQGLPPAMFVCPESAGVPGVLKGGIAASSNWELIPDNLTYSMATPYPGATGISAGFQWRDTIKTDFALISDMNPGTRGGGNPPNNVTGPAHNAASAQLAAANSNNHQNKGQNVLYGDFHVTFERTAYCGAVHAGTGIPDNIFTAGTGDFGACSDTAQPMDAADSVMFPTDDPGGK